MNAKELIMKIARFVHVAAFAILAPATLALSPAPSSSARRAASPAAASLTDWPGWQGPDRTGLSKETGLLKEWPQGGPQVVWSTQGIGGGYGSMAVVGDRVYVQGMRNGSSIVSALNRADGKNVWSNTLGRSG